MTDERSDAWIHQAVQYERISPAFAKEVAEALAANAATIAAQAAAIACAEGIHQQMTAELAAQAAEIERLLDGNTAMLSRNIDLTVELDAAKQDVEQAHQARDVAERDRKSLAVIVETFQEMYGKLVDLFDPEMRGVSPLHYVEEQIAALRSQLEEQRAKLDGAEATITRTGQRARSLLIYTQNGHYGPDHSGLELLREIIDLAANSDEQTPTPTEPSQ